MATFQNGIKFQSIVEFREFLPAGERIITDVLRGIVTETLPATCREKLTYNVPFYYGKRRICMVWPAAVPWGGIRQGVLLGFSYGYKLKDKNSYLTHGTNKQVFYKIFKAVKEIDEQEIILLLNEAVKLDSTFKR
jgi:hypothetical protein